MPPPSDDATFNTEALKLLLQVAWADDALDPAERRAVSTLGAEWKVAPAELERLLTHLDLGKPLPQPNLALLRTRPDGVIAAAEALAAADGVFDDQEREFVEQVKQMLGRG